MTALQARRITMPVIFVDGRVEIALVRYRNDGSLDSGFDGDGKLTTGIGDVDVANSVAIQADGACLKDAAAGDGTDAQGCLTRATSSVDAKVQKTIPTETTKCPPAPPFGLTNSGTVNTAALQSQVDLMADIFGSNLTSAILPASNAAGSECQPQVLKFTQKMFNLKAKLFRVCEKKGLAGKTALMVSTPHLARCFDDLAGLSEDCDQFDDGEANLSCP